LHGSVPKARGGESSVLLEITPVVKSEDVHEVVGRIQQKAQQILSKELNIDAKATVGFAMTLSEICQNIVEHAGRGGWVGVQAYTYKKRLANRRVVVIAVCDAGCGFRESLESAPGRVRNDRWDDAAALEEAVIRGVSRFRDPGRGQGLAGVRRYVGRWDGKVSVRSGTAKIAIVPSWDDDVPLLEKLAPFPGSQVQVTIPERVAGNPR
jgi:anti-sigma regulatory factor (Ser/Thr protein kinase)